MPGVVAVAATKDRIVHQGAVGHLDGPAGNPVKIDTLFAIASMTKPVTSVAVNDVHLFPGATNKFGLGFLLNAKPVPGGRAAGSLMRAGALNTYFWIDRKRGVGGVIMTQLAPFADAAVLALVEDYEKAVYTKLRQE